MDGLLSTWPASEYNITCLCCSGKSGIIHMIPIFNNNDIEDFVKRVKGVPFCIEFYTVKSLCAMYVKYSLHEQNLEGTCITNISFPYFCENYTGECNCTHITNKCTKSIQCHAY